LSDPFHVVAWATEALDQTRRDAWNAARGGKGGATQESKALKQARWALRKNPQDLTEAQQTKLNWIARTPGYIGHGRSRRACAPCSSWPANAPSPPPSTPWTGGCPGRGAAHSRLRCPGPPGRRPPRSDPHQHRLRSVATATPCASPGTGSGQETARPRRPAPPVGPNARSKACSGEPISQIHPQIQQEGQRSREPRE
jgi:hypothetical protein